VEISRPLFFAAIALSVVSAASSAYLAFGRHAPAPANVPGAAACACDDASVKREIAELRRALDARGTQPRSNDPTVERLAARVAELETRSGVTAPSRSAGDVGAPPSPTASGAPSLLPDGHPAFTSFDLPSSALTVRQEPGGGLAVTNSDPALAGKGFTVTAHAADGSTHEVYIVIPPPEGR